MSEYFQSTKMWWVTNIGVNTIWILQNTIDIKHDGFNFINAEYTMLMLDVILDFTKTSTKVSDECGKDSSKEDHICKC